MLGDQAYQNALRRREVLKREMDQLRAEAEEIDSFLEMCDRYARMGGAPVTVTADSAPPDLLSPRSKPSGDLATVSGMALLPHIRRAVLEIGKPLRRGAIVQALEKQGIRVGGKGKPENNIGTLMWRASKDDGPFISLPKGYWPRDVACAAASYEPHRRDRIDDEAEAEPAEPVTTTGEDHKDSPIGDELPVHPWEQAAKGA